MTKQTLGPTDLKLGMHTQIDSRNKMGWVPLGHTFLSWCIRLNIVCVHVCLCESTSCQTTVQGMHQRENLGGKILVTLIDKNYHTHMHA